MGYLYWILSCLSSRVFLRRLIGPQGKFRLRNLWYIHTYKNQNLGRQGRGLCQQGACHVEETELRVPSTHMKSRAQQQSQQFQCWARDRQNLRMWWSSSLAKWQTWASVKDTASEKESGDREEPSTCSSHAHHMNTYFYPPTQEFNMRTLCTSQINIIFLTPGP